jgi:hypothetical protein
MADERDLQLLDDYLTNQMSEQDRSAFEQKLNADPDLKHEYVLQKRLIQGIKDARVAELKSMLNNVPVPAGSPGNSLVSKVVFGTVVGLMIAAAAYWYFRADHPVASEQKAQDEQRPVQMPEKPQERIEIPAEKQESTATQKETIETDKNQTSAGTEHSKPSLARKPDPLAAPGEKNDTKAGDKPAIDVFTPGNNDANNSDSNHSVAKPLAPASSSLVVETDRNNKSYSFHYQFRDGKLFLYGPFEKDLYEIMEFFTDDHRTVFLYYKDHYYMLQEADSKVNPLSPITDAALISKLKEYRNSK